MSFDHFDFEQDKTFSYRWSVQCLYIKIVREIISLERDIHIYTRKPERTFAHILGEKNYMFGIQKSWNIVVMVEHLHHQSIN